MLQRISSICASITLFRGLNSLTVFAKKCSTIDVWLGYKHMSLSSQRPSPKVALLSGKGSKKKESVFGDKGLIKEDACIQ